jgi:uncharacterized phage infection (PIP) family protein YhgE
MQNIGFVEKNDSEKSEMIKFLVDSAKGINLSKMTKEVSPMTDTTENTVEEVVSDEATLEAVEVAPEADAVVEEAHAEEVSEEAAVETEEAEKVDDVPAEEEVVVEETPADDEVSKSDDVASAISEIKDGIASAFSDLNEVVKSLSDEVASLKKSLNSVSSKLEDAERGFDEFGKRMDAVEADTAFRKSGDLGEIVQEVQMKKSEQSLWGGRFLKTADLFK